MYASNQMLRIHHDEWLRSAETRRQVNQAAASSQSPPRGRWQLRFRRIVGLRRPVSPA